MGVSKTSLPGPVITVVGPTATGKSDLAVALAKRLGAEIINADAMQLYKGMDIGTAKLPRSERGGVPHHLLDVLDIRQNASVQRYQTEARAVITELAAAGRRAVLVGGSGLYVRAAVDKLDFPPRDDAVRAALERRARCDGPQCLFAELAVADPAAAAKIDPANVRRVVRALEVIELTGKPFSATLPDYTYEVPAVQIGLGLDRQVLGDRIAARVDRMWRNGLVDEVRSLESRGLREGGTARRALGYAQVLDHLAGHCTEREAFDGTVAGTRRYVRRQETWFRRDKRINWLDAGQGSGELLDKALRLAE
ncbi:tRNA (adenosine(37)-N6)-dimethylallyltransferase MiaA [Spelaeicoccus albus]